ncbi:glycosyltransferase family 4 protein [Patescibacteria group bacterium]|nr:glycosyltransferase family 4 protein [Patescibacteria group bacterium]
MNIGIDIRSLLLKERSGVGEYTYQILDALFRIDQKNNYFLFYNSWKGVGDFLPAEWKKFENVHFCGFHWPNKLLNFCFKFLGWPKIDKMVFPEGKIDLFFIPNLNFISLSHSVKKIITVHDLSFERFPKFFSWKRRLWHWFVNPRKLIRSADKIIAVSENTARDLAELYDVSRDKMKIIYSGVNSGSGVSDVEAVKKKYNLPENFILFLGTLEPRKNIGGLIRAFEILKTENRGDHKLVIVGPQGWLYKKILARAEESPVRDDIKFINYIAPEEKFVFYKLAKLFVYPSFYEGFGFPPLEAARVGTPVIVSTNSSLPEVMGVAALMVDPSNPAEMAKVMEQCLSDENLRVTLIEKGKAQAEKFNWQKCAEEVLTVLG